MPARTFHWPFRLPQLLALIVTITTLVVYTQGFAQENEVRRVLILSDLGALTSPGIAEMEQALYSGLNESRFQIELYNESLETTLFSDDASQRQIRDGYIRKYQDRKPNLIITVGPSSLRFMIEAHEAFFPNTPVVFCGTTKDMLRDMQLDAHFTGAWGTVEPAKTLNLVLRLLPGTKQVTVVGGTGSFDRDVEAIVRKAFRDYTPVLEFTYLTDLDMPALLQRLRHLPDHSIVYHTSIMEDASGGRFIDATQSIPLVAAAANAPVFVFDDVDVGRGSVGGHVLSWAAQGQAAAGMAIRILGGHHTQDIPVAEISNVDLFDARSLARWGLRESDLPPGSIVVNRQFSAWEAYKWYIITGISVIVTELLLIGALLRHRVRRRKTERALRTSEETFSKAFRHSPMALTIIRAADDRYLDVNETFEYLTGWKREEVLGRTPFELGHWNNPEQRAHLRARLFAGQSVRNFEFSVCSKNGEMRTRLGSAELIDLHGEQCILLVATDITDLKRAEATLRESEERFRLMANTAPVMIWMSGTDKLCTYANRPWLEFTGRSLEQELGNGWAEGIHPEDLGRCLDTYANAFDRREPFGMEYRFRRGDGEYRWIFDSGVPRFEADGSFAGYIGSAIDISDRKQAEEILSKINQRLIDAQEEERTRIARDIHDDISQRLSLLVLKLERLRRNAKTTIPISGNAVGDVITLACEINHDTQALSHRLHSSKLEHLGLAATVASYCRELSEEREVIIDLYSADLPNNLPLEISLCVFRVLQEALQNAIKHSGSKQLYVSLGSESNEIHLTVRDSGRGFDTAATKKGWGLGMTTMRERLKLVNGRLQIDSQPESGTTILACVPLDSAMKFVHKAEGS